MVYTPLAQVADFNAGPLAELVRDFSPAEQTNLMVRSSRAVEAYCNRRLAPFTGLTESHRAQDIDPDEAVDMSIPMDLSGTMGMSQAQAFGGFGDLVRHFWVRQRPPIWQDLWVGSLSSVTVYRALAGSSVIPVPNVTYESDTGHVKFSLGQFVPQGSTIVAVYSGGYSPVPDDLIQATLYKAALLAMLDLAPQARPDMDAAELNMEMISLLAPYLLEL